MNSFAEPLSTVVHPSSPVTWDEVSSLHETMDAAGRQPERRESRAVVDRKTYRDAMARFGAAVHIVTTIGPSGARGFTVSAACSVTDDPPILLLCVNRSSDSHDPIQPNGVLCVNTLAASHEALSGIFAGSTGLSGQDRFQHGAWTTLTTGSPVLKGAVVSFDCRIATITVVGTHTVFFCTVEAIASASDQEGLIYFGRSYHRVGAKA